MKNLTLMAGLVASSIVLSACGASDSSDSSPSGGEDAPKGAPVLLGWINQDAPGSVPTYPGTKQALAAAKYVNDVLGGVAGRPLKLVTCSTNGSPESSQKCANTMISKGVKIVTKNFDAGWNSIVSTLQTANIAVIGGQPGSPAEYGAPNAFYYIGSGATTVPAMAKLATQVSGGQNIALLTTDNPLAKAALPLMEGTLKAAGVTPEIISAPDAAADFSPYAAAVVKADPDVMIALLTPPQCLPAMKALASAELKKPVVSTGLCNDPKILKSAGSAADGWSFGIGAPDLSVSPEAPTSAIYREVWKKYGKGRFDLSAVAGLGVIDVVDIAKQIDVIPADVLSGGSAKDVLTAVRSVMTAPGAKDPLLGTELRCGQSKILPAICGFDVYFVEQKDGKLAAANGGKPVSGFAG